MLPTLPQQHIEQSREPAGRRTASGVLLIRHAMNGIEPGLTLPKVLWPTSRQVSIPYTSADDEIIPVAKALFHKLYQRGKPVRLLGVRLSNLSNDAVQTSLFQNTEKKRVLYKAIDDVKNRFGGASVYRASGK